MMEGEPETPGAVRLPDEETAFVGRKVEAPRRRQSQQHAKKKRIAVMGVSVVTMLAFGAVCSFLAMPSETTEQVKTTVSQAMESDPASATTSNPDKVFVPSFAVYDEDGDGKVSLGEYLDRLAINRDAALQRVDESSLDETEKTRISDLLNENFSKHSDCVSTIAQEHDDEMMTEANFDEIYKEITTEFCPMDDDRIADSYQATETAMGLEELAPVKADPDMALWGPTTDSSCSGSEPYSESASASGSESSEAVDGSGDGSSQDSIEAEWNPEKPVAPPRPVTNNDAKPVEGISGSQPNDEKQWTPKYPTDPSVPSSGDTKAKGWNPDEPTDPPSVASPGNDGAETELSSSASGEAEDTTGNGIGDGQWNPAFPTDPPSPSSDRASNHDSSTAYNKGTADDQKPEAVTTRESPFTESATEGERPSGAYNAYTGATDTGAETTTYGESTGTRFNPEVVVEEIPAAKTETNIGGNADGEDFVSEHESKGTTYISKHSTKDKNQLRGIAP